MQPQPHNSHQLKKTPRRLSNHRRPNPSKKRSSFPKRSNLHQKFEDLELCKQKFLKMRQARSHKKSSKEEKMNKLVEIAEELVNFLLLKKKTYTQ